MVTPPHNLDADLAEALSRVHVFVRARRLACYVVGGWLRDWLLGRAPTYLNVDLAISRGALGVARELAPLLRGAFVPLDEAAGSARVVVPMRGSRLELDLSDFRGPTLEADLGRRDFTINAMAMALEDWLRDPRDSSQVIDPLQGRQALARRQLIPCFEGTFDEDPVRILRAFRFAAQLGFAIDPRASPLMARALPRLSSVSGERIRDELLAICDTDRASLAVCELNALGALDHIVPELALGRGMDQGAFHHLDVLEHQLETVAQADRFLSDFAEFTAALRGPLAAYCRQELVERRSRKSLIKLSGLIHDVGKPANRQVHEDGEIWFLGHEQTGGELAANIAERLCLANREIDLVCHVVRHHLRPGFLSREAQLTRRAVYRFYKDLGEHGPACLLTWWADRMATRGSKSRLDQIDEQRARLEELLKAFFFQADEVIRPPRLLTGHQVMAQCHLQPGPLVGELLSAIEEAQAEGRIRTAAEALALAQDLARRQS